MRGLQKRWGDFLNYSGTVSTYLDTPAPTLRGLVAAVRAQFDEDKRTLVGAGSLHLRQGIVVVGAYDALKKTASVSVIIDVMQV